ncbi:MAG: DUF222 domain-containing protein [Actinomycetota bacterium]
MDVRVAEPLAHLTAAVDGVAAIELDELSRDALDHLLGQLQGQLGRTTAVRAAAVANRQRRAATSGRGEQKAERETQSWLRDQLQLPPGEAKRTVQAGKQAARPGPAADGFRAGQLSEAHLSVIADATRGLRPVLAARLEAELVEAARSKDPVGLGRLARRRLLELDQQHAREAERRRHARRRLSMAATEDGGVRISGQLYGLQAEKAMTAFHAFHTHDGADERRPNDQRGADAFEALCDVALRTGEAASQHGIRPHLQIQLPWQALAEQAGVAELGFTGPVSFEEIRPLLSDVAAGRVVLDADRVPIEVSRQVRTVPAGLWRALLARDGGCTWQGCDAPPAWCQAAHGNTPYRLAGRLQLDNAALLCARHHRRFDAGGWTMHIDGDAVTYHQHDAAGGRTTPAALSAPTRASTCSASVAGSTYEVHGAAVDPAPRCEAARERRGAWHTGRRPPRRQAVF